MNFKAYDILSSLVPGFLFFLVLCDFFQYKFDKDLAVAYTAIAFLLGYLINGIGSWLEGFYYLTWNGKPSENLLNGKDIWKVKFYQSEKVKQLLLKESSNKEATNGELFSLASRAAVGVKDSRIEDFNTSYAFSRTLLTTSLLGTILLVSQHSNDWRYYVLLIPTLFISWLRCKQRGYYFAREVLNEYLKKKLSSTPSV